MVKQTVEQPEIGQEEFGDLTPQERFLSGEYLNHEVISLEARSRISADVILDLQASGPLYLFALDMREKALRALRDMIDVDARDALAVGHLQREVQAFFDVLGFIDEKLRDGRRVTDEINQTYGEDDDSDDGEGSSD